MRTTSWIATVTILSTLICTVAARYLMLDPATYFEEQHKTYIRKETVLITHVAALGTLLCLWAHGNSFNAFALNIYVYIAHLALCMC